MSAMARGEGSSGVGGEVRVGAPTRPIFEPSRSGWPDSNRRNLSTPNRALYQAELHPVGIECKPRRARLIDESFQAGPQRGRLATKGRRSPRSRGASAVLAQP